MYTESLIIYYKCWEECSMLFYEFIPISINLFQEIYSNPTY